MRTVKRNISKTAEQYAGSSSNIEISGGSGGALADQWFYMDSSTGVVHCRYNFAGDGEISAMAPLADPNGILAQMKQTLADLTAASTTAEIAEALVALKEIL